jgi:hypothetical protein
MCPVLSVLSGDDECLKITRLHSLPKHSDTLGVGIYRVGFSGTVPILLRLRFVHQSHDGKAMGPEVGLPTTDLKGRMKLLATSPDDILFGNIPPENAY